MTPEEVKALIHETIDAKLDPIETKLDTIISTMDQFNGASKLAKGVFWIVAPIIAGFVWLKDHVRL